MDGFEGKRFFNLVLKKLSIPIPFGFAVEVEAVN